MYRSFGEAGWPAAVALVASLGAAAVWPAQGDDPLRSARVQVSRPGEPSKFPTDNLALTSRRVAVPAGTDLETLLREHGIYPDGESFAAVYLLNPDLRQAAVASGSSVLLPWVTGPDSVLEALTRGYFAFITLDPDLKRRLAERVRGLRRLERAVMDLPPERFGGPAARDTVERAVRRLGDFGLAVGLAMQERTRPVDLEVLGLIEAEFGVVQAALEGALAGEPLDAGDRTRIVAAADQADARAAYWTESHGPGQAFAPYPKVWLQVDVLRGGARVPGLRVYYSWPALLGRARPQAFGRLTSTTQPVRAELDVANYVVWATGATDTAAVTPLVTYPLRLRDGAAVDTVELQVRR